MLQDATWNGDDLDEKLIRWALQGRDDALRSNRSIELTYWTRALNFLMRTGSERALQVMAEYEATTAATPSGPTDFLAAT